LIGTIVVADMINITTPKHCDKTIYSATVLISSPSLAGHNGDCHIGSSPDSGSLHIHTFPGFPSQWHTHGFALHYSGGTVLDFHLTSLLSPKGTYTINIKFSQFYSISLYNKVFSLSSFFLFLNRSRQGVLLLTSRQTAVYCPNRTINKGCTIRCQKTYDIGNFLRLSNPPDGIKRGHIS